MALYGFGAINEILFKEVFAMIYEMLFKMEEANESVGVSPLAYVALNCAR